MNDDTVPMEQQLRRSVLSREAGMDRRKNTFIWGFAALYVFSATFSQITLAVLLNYLIAGAKSAG